MAEHVGSQFEPWRLRFVIIGLAGVFFIFLGRLFGLQIINGQEYLEQADENRTSTITLHTERGVIYDRNGYVLARNIPSYNVTIIPAEMPDDDGDIEEIYRELSELIDWPVTDLELTDETARLFTPCATEFGIREIVELGWSIAPYDPVRIVCDVERDVAMTIEENQYEWPGVGVEVVPIRDYPTGQLTSEVVGFLGPIPATLEDYYVDLGFVPNIDKVGYAGVESSLDEILRGTNGLRTVEIDALGQVLRDLEDPLEPVPGLNVKLTIDTRLQNAAKAALNKHMTGWNNFFGEERFQNGVVIAMNPKTGEVLAMVSMPSIENNRMARFIPGDYYEQIANDPLKPLINHAISAEHPPGSVYKLPTSVGVLNEGVIDLNREIFCPPSIIIMQKFTPNDPGTPQEFVDWIKDESGNRIGHGWVDWHHAIAYSADVYYYQVSGGYQDVIEKGLGVWRMADYARALGYGEPTGIELPGEENGLVPDPDWKRINVGETWATGDTYIASMGQGYVLATPLQVLVSFNTIINQGKYMQPTIVYQVLDENGNIIEDFEPELKWDLTKDAKIPVYDEFNFLTGEMKTIDLEVFQEAMVGMRLVVTDQSGTARKIFEGSEVESGGKTGTAEYCDEKAQAEDRCKPGEWPAHAWYVGYAPYDDPEIAVVAFVYDGTEGSQVAGPIVREVLEAFFELKKVENPTGN
ncbi:MAG: penicillin-binding protein 2 [Anaerolineae bacterium]|jgi:penicillin-binding protein 2|nr:penicillin-binding protein 2 [Anaerolineae bacterium]